MNSILVEEWDAFNVSAGNIIGDILIKKTTSLQSSRISTNSQACVSSIHVSSGTKSEDINVISHHTVGPIKEKKISTENTTVFLQENGAQQ